MEDWWGSGGILKVEGENSWLMSGIYVPFDGEDGKKKKLKNAWWRWSPVPPKQNHGSTVRKPSARGTPDHGSAITKNCPPGSVIEKVDEKNDEIEIFMILFYLNCGGFKWILKFKTDLGGRWKAEKLKHHKWVHYAIVKPKSKLLIRTLPKSPRVKMKSNLAYIPNFSSVSRFCQPLVA